MSVAQEWITLGLLGGLLLLFPPFSYGPHVTDRQWHFYSRFPANDI
jgi:hypothetical protein